MRKHILIIMILIALLAVLSCDNPIETDLIYNWEGHGNEFNEAYRDSILFASTRIIGTQYIPALHYMYKDGSGIHSMINLGVTNGAAWSPRKWKILFRLWLDPYGDEVGLFIMNYDGSEMKRLTSQNEYPGLTSWSPDGQLIAYLDIDTLTLTGKIKIMRPDGSGKRIITTTNYYSRISWMTDSKTIVFDKDQDAVYSINIDGSGLTKIFSFPVCIRPVCSPDGNFIAFSGRDSISRSTKIYSYNINTRNFKQLTKGSLWENSSRSYDYHPSWSPDSKYLVFHSLNYDDQRLSSIYIMNSDGSDIKRITDILGHDYNPSWSNN